MTRTLLVLAALAGPLVACNGPEDTETDLPDAPTGPALEWVDQPSEALVEGEALTITVQATDDDGVARVVTYYRTAGERTWITAPDMEEGEDGSWTVTVPAEEVAAPGIELYFKGEDALGEASFLPQNGVREPYVVDVRRVGLGLPYSQDFEEVLNEDLRQIGWSERTRAFAGYEWGLTTGRAFSGEASVVHRRTPSTVDQDIEDWLISPPLDLTTLPEVQVSWMEYGDGADLAVHELYLSTGSPDPADGDFERVAELSAPPEGAWGRSDTVDLTAYGDAPAAYLAWVYKGRQADVWWLDDVQVRALAPDLRVDDITWTPDPLAPGDTGTLTLTVANRTDVVASAVEVLVVADQDITFSDIDPIATIAGGDSVEVEVPLTVAGDALDNNWIDLDISLSTEADTWDYQERMLVGQPSVLDLTYTVDALDEADTAQLVRAQLGVGDPLSPTFEIPLLAELQSSGTYDISLDITEYAAYLPPAPGENRWWVRFENGPSGSVDALEITYGGEAYTTTDTGPFFGFAPEVFFLPRPPEPIVRSQVSLPSTIAPGDDVSWTLTLLNNGERTSGTTTVTLTTDDPGVTLTDAGPVEVAGVEGWGAGVQVSPRFAFSVDAARKNSLPVRMVATVEDDFETFTVPVDVEVPWPVVSVTGVLIDDFSDGDDDGVLDPDESASIELSISNVGGLGTFGSTSCTLVQTGGAATVSIETTSVFAGIISSGSSEEEDFDLTVTSGSDGDDLQLRLTCTDRDETYVSDVELVLGERPWIRLTPLPDATGDERDGYRFDFVDGRYRGDDSALEIQLRSSKPHGGLTGLFVEAWASSPGADYTYYNFVAAGTSGTMRGYRRSFFPLGSFTVSEVDSNTIQFEIPLSGLGLREGGTSMAIGFGAGFCGGTEQFCDHYPNGWGAPYTGLSTSRWTTMRW